MGEQGFWAHVPLPLPTWGYPRRQLCPRMATLSSFHTPRGVTGGKVTLSTHRSFASLRGVSKSEASYSVLRPHTLLSRSSSELLAIDELGADPHRGQQSSSQGGIPIALCMSGPGRRRECDLSLASGDSIVRMEMMWPRSLAAQRQRLTSVRSIAPLTINVHICQVQCRAT